MSDDANTTPRPSDQPEHTSGWVPELDPAAESTAEPIDSAAGSAASSTADSTDRPGGSGTGYANTRSPWLSPSETTYPAAGYGDTSFSGGLPSGGLPSAGLPSGGVPSVGAYPGGSFVTDPSTPGRYPEPAYLAAQYAGAEYAGLPQSAAPYPAPTVPIAGAPPLRRLRASLAATAIVAAVIGGGAGATTVALTRSSSSSTVASGVTVTTATAQNSAAVTDATVSSAAAKITPSVVTIQVKGSSESGTGSGVIIRSDGYILTNDHVVSVAANGGSITVETSDGRTASATVVGRDSTDDLAVIKVSGLSNLSAATFAKSSSVTVGQTVVAVGAPLGLSETVTSGIISAKARTVRSGDNDDAVFSAIQTDAAINPGNSGGALVDLNGNVIGINAAIASTSSSGVTVPGQPTTQSGSIGIGFAIPSDEASRVSAELIATGKASHAVLGVSVQSSTSSSSSTTSGAVLSAVTAGGAAATAGLQAGDVVTAVDSTRIEEGDDLIAAIRAHAVKDTVTITYTRGGSSHTTKATLTAGS